MKGFASGNVGVRKVDNEQSGLADVVEAVQHDLRYAEICMLRHQGASSHERCEQHDGTTVWSGVPATVVRCTKQSVHNRAVDVLERPDVRLELLAPQDLVGADMPPKIPITRNLWNEGYKNKGQLGGSPIPAVLNENDEFIEQTFCPRRHSEENAGLF